jgi:hypothetical protein
MNPTSPHPEFQAIYADPPWNFRNYSNKGTGRNPVSHYDCMSLNDMKKLSLDGEGGSKTTVFDHSVQCGFSGGRRIGDVIEVGVGGSERTVTMTALGVLNEDRFGPWFDISQRGILSSKGP